MPGADRRGRRRAPRRGGRDALTTRAVAAAAGVQAPTIYRLFGDKGGLLDAVAEHGFATLPAGASRSAEPGPDPVEDLRAGWDLHIGFGLANPAIYALMYGDPRPGVASPRRRGRPEVLERHVHRIAAAGRLRVSEGERSHLVHAAGLGTVLALLAMPEDAATRRFGPAREAVIAAITTDAPGAGEPEPGDGGDRAARRAAGRHAALSDGERHLLDEWLDRLADGSRLSLHRIATASVTRSHMAVTHSSAANGPLICVIEDEEVIASAVAARLRAEGFVVEVAARRACRGRVVRSRAA